MQGSRLNLEAAQAYSRTFSNLVLDQFFSQKEGISGQEIISVTPVKQVNFFVLKVLFDRWQEETKKFKSPFFNYRNTEVNQALKTLVNTLSKNILIEKEDFRPLLEQATFETLQLLYDPEGYYHAQADTLGSSNKDIRSVSKYIKLHKGLYEEIVHDLPSAQGDLKAATTSALASHSLDEAEIDENVQAFNQVAALDVLEEEQEVVSLEAPEPELPEAAVPEQDQPINVNGHNAPMDDEFQRQFKPVEDEQTNVPGSINEKYAHQDVKSLNEMYEEQEVKETIASKHESTSISDLAKSISINQRYMFLSELFEGNESDYHAALEAIESRDSFDDSVEFLVQNYSRQYAWDMSSDEVKEFLKVIFKRFR